MKTFQFSSLILLFISLQLGLHSQSINMTQGTLTTEDENFTYYDPNGTASYQDTGIYIVQTLCSGIFGDPAGTGNYTNSNYHIVFTEFALGLGDTLFIYNGDSPNPANLIGAYNGVNSPGDIYAEDECVTFVFSTDGLPDLQGMNEGWVALFSPYWEEQTIYDAASNTHQNGQISTTCNGKFRDPGGAGNYTHGQLPSSGYIAVFIADGGQHIKAEKNVFNIGSGAVMEIYDGNLVTQAATARRIGHFKQGYAPPEVLISSGTTLSFKITPSANSNTSAQGWEFDISCVSEIYEQADGSSGCPEIIIQNAEGEALPESINFDCQNPMLLLHTKVNVPGDITADYTVKSIPYDPPFPYFGGGLSQVDADDDDNWLPGIQLPFNFTFYGTSYNNVYLSTNGAISFTNRGTGSSGWSYNQTIPNIASATYEFIPNHDHKNSAFLVFQDIDPRYTNGNGGVYRGVLGEYPCRTYVLSYYEVPDYQVHSQLSTYQMVFYEGTNIIDVYVQKRNCSSWNSGSGVIGVLSNQGNMAVVAPGRNTGNWTISTPEAWRFTPISPISALDNIKWYKNSISPENEITNNNRDKRLITLFPEESTLYYVVLSYTTSSGEEYTIKDSVQVNVEMPPFNLTSSDDEVCPNEEVTLEVNAVSANDQGRLVDFQWFIGSMNNTTITDRTNRITVRPNETTTYIVRVTYDNNCEKIDSITIRTEDMTWPVIVGDTIICDGEQTTLTATEAAGGDIRWNTGATQAAIVVSPAITTNYMVSVTSSNGCVTDDTITIYVNPRPNVVFTPTPQHVFVEDGQGTINFVNFSTGGNNDSLSFRWNFGDRYCIPNDNLSTEENPTHIFTHAGHFDVTLVALTQEGCSDSIMHTVIVEVPYFFYVPNAFSPNSDGVNDVFKTYGEGLDFENFEMLIFDRFGQLIFKTTTPFDYWDGRDRKGRICPMGEYVYKITTSDMDGYPKIYTGTVMLIR